MNLDHVTLTQLRALVQVIETGGFTAASERLHLSQSAVSHAVRELERKIGCRLLDRSRREVRPTSAGLSALAQARAALDAVDALLRVGRTDPAGTVTVATVVSASIWLLPGVLERLRSLYPSIEVRVLVGTDREVAMWVAGGLADLGVTYDTGGRAATRLRDDAFVAICGPADTPAAGSATLEQLAQRPFVMPGSGCGPMVEEIFERAGVRPRVVTTVSDTGALLALVRAGVGVSIVPALTLACHEGHGVSHLTLEPPEPRPLSCVASDAPSAPEAAAVMLELLSVGAREGPA